MLLFPINRFSSQISIFPHFWQFHIYHDALTFIKCLIPFFILFYRLLVFNGYSFLLYYNFSYGQALKVNWAYTNNQREDTSGYFRLPFFFILLIDFVACWVPFINIHMFFPFMHFKNHQDTSIYLLVIWVQRLLMQRYLRASQYILVVREFFIPLNISFYTILSWVGTR